MCEEGTRRRLKEHCCSNYCNKQMDFDRSGRPLNVAVNTRVWIGFHGDQSEGDISLPFE